MNDALIINLVLDLDGHTFPLDSSKDGVDYFAADVQLESSKKINRIIWLFEGEKLEIIGIINAYRRSKKGK